MSTLHHHLKQTHMTFMYSVSVSEMHLLITGQKKFDILQFRRPVSIGDTIIYQLEHLEPEEGLPVAPNGPETPDEYSVKIDYLFDDTEGALKKGYHAVGFFTKSE